MLLEDQLMDTEPPHGELDLMLDIQEPGMDGTELTLDTHTMVLMDLMLDTHMDLDTDILDIHTDTEDTGDQRNIQ